MSSKTLLEALAEMPDPRGRKGLIHPLPTVMGPVVLAMPRSASGTSPPQ